MFHRHKWQVCKTDNIFSTDLACHVPWPIGFKVYLICAKCGAFKSYQNYQYKEDMEKELKDALTEKVGPGWNVPRTKGK